MAHGLHFTQENLNSQPHYFHYLYEPLFLFHITEHKIKFTVTEINSNRDWELRKEGEENSKESIERLIGFSAFYLFTMQIAKRIEFAASKTLRIIRQKSISASSEGIKGLTLFSEISYSRFRSINFRNYEIFVVLEI